jgi:hypothetical protein
MPVYPGALELLCFSITVVQIAVLRTHPFLDSKMQFPESSGDNANPAASSVLLVVRAR